ncbi:MAG: hypothetical protein IIW81_05190 [Oscillospiraceae bacterium]|nr:hypothetical protein [Oscillospiraceae bacterium]
MNDRRRALLSGGFPQNYIFKQGLGFRKDIVWGQAVPSNGYLGYVSVTKDFIHLDGYYGGSASKVAPSILYIGSPKIEYNSDGRLVKNAINVENFSKIYFHLKVTSSNNTRAAYIGLIKCSELPNRYIRYEQPTSSSYSPGGSKNLPDGSDTAMYWDGGGAVHKIVGVTTAAGEYTIGFDISSVNETMIALWSGDFSGRDLIIYDIWFE